MTNMETRKIIRITGIIIIALIINAVIAYVLFHVVSEKKLISVIEDMDAITFQLVAEFEGTNPDDSAQCEQKLLHIGETLYSEIEGRIEFIQDYTSRDATDEAKAQLALLQKESNDAGFSFSSAALNECRLNRLHKPEADTLKQSLLQLREDIQKLKEFM
jgi:hypothetical protein